MIVKIGKIGAVPADVIPDGFVNPLAEQNQREVADPIGELVRRTLKELSAADWSELVAGLLESMARNGRMERFAKQVAERICPVKQQELLVCFDESLLDEADEPIIVDAKP